MLHTEETSPFQTRGHVMANQQAEPAKELNLDLGGGVTMKLVLIRAGRFMMGSPDSEKGRGKNESPQHEVTLSKPFYMGVTEVTQIQYEAIMGTNPSKFKGPANPVEMVFWNDATEFCKKLSEKTRQAVRLPTEAEWEYAWRGYGHGIFLWRRRKRRWRLCMARWKQRLYDASRRPEETERLGSLRHARQRLGMVRGLVRRLCEWRGNGPPRPGVRRASRFARRFMGLLRLGRSRQLPCRDSDRVLP